MLEQLAGKPSETFDLVVCDPPPASASKRARRFDLQRDHEQLLLSLRDWLSPGGAILFSSNLGGFQLSPKVFEVFQSLGGGRELTPASLPEDFRGRPPHRAFLLGAPWLAATS